MVGAPPGDMPWMMGGIPPGMNPAAAAMMRNQFGFGTCHMRLSFR